MSVMNSRRRMKGKYLDQIQGQLIAQIIRERKATNPFDAWWVFEALPSSAGFLFWHGKGKRYENVSSRFSGLTTSLELEHRFKFHDPRHLHAVEWLQSGRSIYDLQQRLGHASIKTTEMYLQFLTPEEKRKAMGQ
jgi:integrase